MKRILLLIAVLLPAVANAAGLSLVGTASGSGNAAVTAATTGAMDTTGANFFVASITGFSSPGTLTDSKSNAWLLLGTSSVNSGGITSQSFYLCNPATTGTGHTFTATLPPQYSSLIVAAFRGQVIYDGSSLSSSTGTTALQPGSLTPRRNGALIISGLCVDNGGGTGVAVDSGLNSVISNATGTHDAGGFGWLIQSSSAAINPRWTWTGSVPAAAQTFCLSDNSSTDPGVANVRVGTAYQLLGTSNTGSLGSAWTATSGSQGLSPFVFGGSNGTTYTGTATSGGSTFSISGSNVRYGSIVPSGTGTTTGTMPVRPAH